ncbi:MAG: hypothetical protein DRQ08_01205 [Candidatus Latescibacterota bacterium]|nr:MAG: hypothetical protein DRQ08_01205 [Candidatus Latescibacterota bacterium]
MLSREEIGEIAERALRTCEADEVEVVVRAWRNYLTRYASNYIHQNLGEASLRITLRAVIGSRMGEASGEGADEGSLRRLARKASELARSSPEDPELLPRLGPQEYRKVDAFCEEGTSPSERARWISEVVAHCRERGLEAAGFFSEERRALAIANSKGLFAFYRRTSFTFSASVTSGEGSGWCERSSWRKDEISPREVGEVAVRKAEMGRNPREVGPGRYTVILEPAAVADLIGYLAPGFDALAVEEGRSFLSGKVGKKLFGDNINIASDVYHPLHRDVPFDSEGVPTKRVQLIRNGVAENLAYDRLTAKRHGLEPTGHGLGPRGRLGAIPRALVMEGGRDTLEEMISSTERGILVTRFHYHNLVDPMKLIVTGMTRDGTFWIEDGRIRFGIKNLRFNQSLLDLLNSVEMTSEPVYVSGAVVPALKAGEFNFTSSTEF